MTIDEHVTDHVRLTREAIDADASIPPDAKRAEVAKALFAAADERDDQARNCARREDWTRYGLLQAQAAAYRREARRTLAPEGAGRLEEVVRNLMLPARASRFWSLAGDRNSTLRQKVVEALTGEKRPKAKCGVNSLYAIASRLLGLPEEHRNNDLTIDEFTMSISTLNR